MHQAERIQTEGGEGVSPEYLARCRKRMDAIDALTPELRACVHDFGWTVVDQFLRCGVQNHKHIRHLVATVQESSGAYGNGRSHRAETDLVVVDLRRRRPDLAIIPRTVTKAMVDASMAAVPPLGTPGATLVLKAEKHRRRLQAAIDLAVKEIANAG